MMIISLTGKQLKTVTGTPLDSFAIHFGR